MLATAYDIGDQVRCSCTFTIGVVNTDPTTITARVKKPDGTVTVSVYGTDVALVKDSVGNYHIDVDATASGTWRYRFEGTGAAKAAEEGTFIVERSRVLA